MAVPEPYFGRLDNDKTFYTFYATKAAADKAFYHAYDPSFLAKKAEVLYGIYKNSTSFLAQAEQWEIRMEGLLRNPETGANDELCSMLATELHCTRLHQTEALLSLLLAEFQDRPDWVYLTTYPNKEIKEAAKAIVAGAYDKLPGRSVAGPEQFVKEAVFAGWDLSTSTVAEQWAQSVESIGTLLTILAEQFVKGQEYNSYKHGLRVVSGQAQLSASMDRSQTNFVPIIALPHAMTYLQIHKQSDGYGGQRHTKQANPAYSHETIQCMATIMAVVKDMRLARIDGKIEHGGFPVFDTKSLDRQAPITNFTFPY